MLFNLKNELIILQPFLVTNCCTVFRTLQIFYFSKKNYLHWTDPIARRGSLITLNKSHIYLWNFFLFFQFFSFWKKIRQHLFSFCRYAHSAKLIRNKKIPKLILVGGFCWFKNLLLFGPLMVDTCYNVLIDLKKNHNKHKENGLQMVWANSYWKLDNNFEFS